MNCLWLYMCVLQPVKIKVPPLPLHLPLTDSYLSLLVFISLTLSCFISALSIPLLAQSSSMELDKNSCPAKYANLSIHLSLSVIRVILVASLTFISILSLIKHNSTCTGRKQRVGKAWRVAEHTQTGVELLQISNNLGKKCTFHAKRQQSCICKEDMQTYVSILCPLTFLGLQSGHN